MGIGCVGLLLHDPTLLPAQNPHDSRQKGMRSQIRKFIGKHGKGLLPHIERPAYAERTGIKAFLHAHNAHARLLVVGEDRVLDWSRTPPARQKRGVHVQAMIRRALENIDRQDHTVCRNDDEVGPILLERGDSLGVFEGRRLLDRNTEAHRGFLHRRCDELFAPSANRIGTRVRGDDVIVLREILKDGCRKVRRAHEDDAHSIHLDGGVARLGALLARLVVGFERADARQGVARLEKSASVQVIDLMLKTAPEKAIAFDFPHLSVEVVIANAGPGLAGNRNGDAGTGQAALALRFGLAFELHDLGVDQNDGILLIGIVNIDDDQAFRHADLGSCNSATVVVVHSSRHLFGELFQAVIARRARLAHLAKKRVGGNNDTDHWQHVLYSIDMRARR